MSIDPFKYIRWNVRQAIVRNYSKCLTPPNEREHGKNTKATRIVIL